MSAFDDWLEQYKLKSDWLTLTEEEDVENAFNAGLEVAAQEAEKQEDRYEKECDTWPEMQPNAVTGIQSAIYAIRALKTNTSKP